MKKFTVLLMILGLALIAVPMAQAVELDFSSADNASIKFNATDSGGGIGTFAFTAGTAPNPQNPPGGNVTADFRITLVNGGIGTAVGDTATITNPIGGWVINGPIGTEAGGAQFSSVSGIGGLDILDHNGDHLTADLQWIKVETNLAATIGNLNDQLALSLTNILYGGTDTDLMAIGNVIFASFQTDSQSLTQLTTGEGQTLSTSYSGDIVPVPPAVWLFGSGLLGLAGFRRRFKK